MAGISSIGVLPEDCISAILSLTTPSDAGKLALVSSMFRSAAESDVVWGRFLPENYEEIVAASELSGEAPLRSKREAFFRLCSPILVDEGKKSFELEKLSGKVIYMLSARELSITWSSDPLCWTWKSHPQSTFPEVVELRTVSWLEINGKIRTKTLSPNTKYGAYLLFKISERAYGLELMPAQLSLQLFPINQPNTNNYNNNHNNSEAYVWSRPTRKSCVYRIHSWTVLIESKLGPTASLALYRLMGELESPNPPHAFYIYLSFL